MVEHSPATTPGKPAWNLLAGESKPRLELRTVLPVFAITVLALALRLWDIGARSLWFDEAVEYWTAISPISQIALPVRAALQPPFYSFVLHVWMQLATGDVWLRLLSVLLSLLGLAGMMYWGYRMKGWPGAAFNALIMAVLPGEIRYAQEIAEYVLVECLLVWAIVALYLTFETLKWRVWGLWAVASILSVYSHYGAAIVIFAITAAALLENLRRRDFQRLRRLVGIALVSSLAWLPLLYFLPKQISSQAHTPRLLAFTAQQMARLVKSPAETFAFQITGWPYSPLPFGLVAGVVAVLLVLVALALFHKTGRSHKRVIVWFWSAFLVYWILVAGGFYAYGVFGFRYSMPLTPLFVQAVMLSVLGFAPARAARPITVATLGLILAISLYSLPNRSLSTVIRGPMLWPETQDVEQAVEYLKKNRLETEPVFINYNGSASVRAYLRRNGWEHNVALPADWMFQCFGKTLAFCVQDNVYYGPWTRGKTGEEKLKTLTGAFGAAPVRFWLVDAYNGTFEDADLVAALSRSYKIVRQFQAANVAVLLFEKKP